MKVGSFSRLAAWSDAMRAILSLKLFVILKPLDAQMTRFLECECGARFFKCEKLAYACPNTCPMKPWVSFDPTSPGLACAHGP